MSARAMAGCVLATWVAASQVVAVDHPVAGTKHRLALKRSRSGAETLLFVARDPGLPFPAPGSGDDPATGVPGGAVVELCSAAGTTATLVAPAGGGVPGWTATEGTHAAFKFRTPDMGV